jgi:anti-sigma B factor antagonist
VCADDRLTPHKASQAGFHFRMHRLPSALVLAVSGEVDLAVEEPFRRALSAAIAEATASLIIELRDTFLDVRGLAAVLAVAADGRARGVPVVLAAPTPLVRRMLAVVDPDRRLPYFESVAEALRQTGEAR